MKQYVLLVVCLLTLTATQTKSITFTKQWDKKYGIHQFTASDKNALASGLYYLLVDKGNEKTLSSTVNQFYGVADAEYHYDCKNAYLKAYEKSALASHKMPKQKTLAWTETLLPYYATVLDMLKDEELTICFGKDQGKKLPATFFELEKAMNPRPKPVSHSDAFFNIQVPGFSIQWQM